MIESSFGLVSLVSLHLCSVCLCVFLVSVCALAFVRLSLCRSRDSRPSTSSHTDRVWPRTKLDGPKYVGLQIVGPQFL